MSNQPIRISHWPVWPCLLYLLAGLFGSESCKPRDTQPLVYRDTVTVTTGLSSGTLIQNSWFPTCKVAPDGAVYFAYQDGAKAGRLTLQRYAKGVWQFVGSPGFTSGGAQNPQLAIAPDGTPYVAYADVENQIRLTVQRFAGGAWQVVGRAGFSNGYATEPALTIASDGTPYVAYEERESFSEKRRVVVQRFNNGSWQPLRGGAFASHETIYPSLATSADGTLYLAYEDADNGYALMVERWRANTWQSLGTVDSRVEMTSASLVVSTGGIPHVVYLNGGHRPSVKRYVDETWSLVGEWDSSPYYAFTPSIAVNSNGTPYIAYGDQARQGSVTVQRFMNSQWQTLADKNYTTDGFGSISMAPDSTVYVGQLGGSMPQRPSLVIFGKVAQ